MAGGATPDSGGDSEDRRPALPGEGQRPVDDPGITLPACPLAERLQRLVERSGVPVGPIVTHRVERVRHRNDARGERERAAFAGQDVPQGRGDCAKERAARQVRDDGAGTDTGAARVGRANPAPSAISAQASATSPSATGNPSASATRPMAGGPARKPP